MDKVKRMQRKLTNNRKKKLANLREEKEEVKVDIIQKNREIMEERAEAIKDFIYNHRTYTHAILSVRVYSNTGGLVYQGSQKNCWAKFTPNMVLFNNKRLKAAMQEDKNIRKVFKEWKQWR